MLVAGSVQPNFSSAQTGSLPELGESSSRYLSPQQEKEIGRHFLLQLLAAPNYISDPELNNYLNSIGRQIGQSADLRGITLHFSLLEENELNAFAVPGGYITFHSGLILTTKTESELASVIGHEIAHLSQRHIPRIIAKAQATKLPTTAAIIASILVGGQAGVAGVTLANANVLSKQLEYSREFETEADAIGMQLMTRSGYDPRDMPQFFNTLQRFNVSSRDVPEFLRSHPLSFNRVAESEARLNSLPSIDHSSSTEFHFARAKIQALYSGRVEQAEEILRDQAKTKQGIEKQASIYGLSLALTKQRKYTQARDNLRTIDAEFSQIPAVLLAQAEIERNAGNTQQAVDLYLSIVEKWPREFWINHYYIDALLDNNDPKNAKKTARYHLRRRPNDFQLYKKLSTANVALGLLAEAHQADGEYYAAIGNYKKAIASMKLALRDNSEESEYLTQSIKSRITALQQQQSDSNKIKKPG